VRLACVARAGRACPWRPGWRAANVRSVFHAIGGVISAAVVLAAFWAAVRLLAGRTFRHAAYPRRLLGPRRRGMLTLHLVRAAGRVLLLAVRFATGAPLGRRRTDATFLSRGTHPVGGVPGWFTIGQPGRWAYLPGWKRAAIRWTVVAAAISLYARSLITAAVLGGLAVAAGVALAGRWRRARYVRAVIRPVYLQLCGYLGTDPAANPLRWLDVPRGSAGTDAVVTLTYPAAWNPDAAKQKNIDEVIRRHLGGDLTATFGPHAATWRHPPAPPDRALFDGYTLPAHRIHLATLAGGRKWVADLENEEPHLFIAAGTGGGKTATAALAAAHARAHGWLIDIIDPKRRSYIDRKTGQDVLTNVPGIRVHTDIEAMMWALEEFFLSMLGVNIAVGSHAAWPGAFPHRMLVIDEFGTFAGMAARIHHRTGAAGPLPALDQRRQIEWQGRVAGHRLLVAVHQPNLRLFADSDSRASYGYRLITGAYTASLWRMTFGFAPPIEWDARIKGRGVVGIGEASSLIHHAQIAWLPAAERRRYALTGPPPPDWFTDLRPAPWITPRVLAEGRKLAGASLVTIPASPVPALAAVPVPPGQHAAPPAETLSGVPPRDTPQVAAGETDDVITGIAAAAGYLGYDKPDSFRRARTRRPIPGETRTPDGRPAWTPASLRHWYAQRAIARNHTTGHDLE
jgi:hypothetical protein